MPRPPSPDPTWRVLLTALVPIAGASVVAGTWSWHLDSAREVTSFRLALALAGLLVLVFIGLVWSADRSRRGQVAVHSEPGGSLARAQLSTVALGRRLRRSESLARAIVDASAEAIFTIDDAGKVRTANRAALELCGTSSTQLVGAPIARLLGEEIADAALEAQPMVLLRADDTARSVLVRARTVDIEDGQSLLTLFVRDETERQELERQLLHEATHDSLTDVVNRANLLTQIERSRSRLERYGGGYAVLLFDIRAFDSINAEYGHFGGDRALWTVADRIVSGCSPADVVARLGGDQFVVLTEEMCDEETAERLAERLVASASTQLHLNGSEVQLAVDCSVVWVDDPKLSPDDVIRRADVARLHGRLEGGSLIHRFDAARSLESRQRTQIVRELREALAGADLSGHIQPIIDLETGRLIGGELLARWTTRLGEEREPDLFVPIAEECGLIVELDRWAIDEACRILAEWSDHPDLDEARLSVNVSGRHVGDPQLLIDVRSSIERHEINPTLLVVELTETYLLRDVDSAIGALTDLRDLGIRIAIDDFGTGFSSLAYLRSLPVDEVKIDRSFVAGIDRDRSSRSIASMVTELAGALGLDVVAEGVEQPGQVATLRQMGCRRAQGSLFSWAVPPDAFVPFADRDWASAVLDLSPRPSQKAVGEAIRAD